MLKHLTVDEMVGLTQPWVDHPERRALFLSIPEIAGLHPKIETAHRELVPARPADKAPSPELSAVIAEATAADVDHDTLARAVHAGVVADRAFALAQRPAATERARQADEALARLLPQGLHIVNVSLLAESGNTARIDALLDQQPELVAFLEAIPVQDFGTLLAVTRRWIEAGERLAQLERQREEIEAQEATASTSQTTINRLRTRWIRLVTQVLSLLELSDADAEAIETIRGPVLKASTRAGRRYGEPEPAAIANEEATADGSDEADDADDDVDAVDDDDDDDEADDDETDES